MVVASFQIIERRVPAALYLRALACHECTALTLQSIFLAKVLKTIICNKLSSIKAAYVLQHK
jgi:hypothetical protein